MVSPEALFDRDSSLLIVRGLYVLRYEAGGASHDHPVAVVRPAAGFERIIQVISAPGGVEGRLERPGAAVLVRAEGSGKIQIGIKRSGSNSSLDAAFRLKLVGVTPDDDRDLTKLSRTPDCPGPMSQIPIAPSVNGSEGALFLAHLSRRGDLSVRKNEWVGGPDFPARIEGLAILGLAREGTPRRSSSSARVQPRNMVGVARHRRLRWDTGTKPTSCWRAVEIDRRSGSTLHHPCRGAVSRLGDHE